MVEQGLCERNFEPLEYFTVLILVWDAADMYLLFSEDKLVQNVDSQMHHAA